MTIFRDVIHFEKKKQLIARFFIVILKNFNELKFAGVFRRFYE
jgi:hypothetical protein